MSSARPTRSSGRRASSSGSASEPLAAAEITPAAAARKASKRSCSNVGTTATQVESEQACSTSKPNLRWCPNSLHSMHSLSEVSILTTETNQMPSISPPHASSGPHTPKSTTHSPQPSFGVRQPPPLLAIQAPQEAAPMETSASVAESILEDGHAACDQPHEAASASILEQLELGGDAVPAAALPAPPNPAPPNPAPPYSSSQPPQSWADEVEEELQHRATPTARGRAVPAAAEQAVMQKHAG